MFEGPIAIGSAPTKVTDSTLPKNLPDIFAVRGIGAEKPFTTLKPEPPIELLAAGPN
jgi:hypothetical protein